MAYKPFDLTGRVALVTGGNRGIGLGMAGALAQAGADIVIWGSNAERNQAAEIELLKHGTRVKAQVVDVSQEDQSARALTRPWSPWAGSTACSPTPGSAMARPASWR